jgi:superfamily II DNA or RNA helicase
MKQISCWTFNRQKNPFTGSVSASRQCSIRRITNRDSFTASRDQVNQTLRVISWLMLVIVHTEDLLKQWLGYIEKVIPTVEVGVIKQSRNEIAQITVATLQTLYKRDFDVEWYRQFGCTILDECLHAPARTFTHVLSHVTSRYRFGMSASENRADNMQPMVGFMFGDTIHQLEFSAAVPVTVRKIQTNFTKTRQPRRRRQNIYQNRRGWISMIDQLVKNEERNKQIAKEVNKQLAHGRSVLVLSRRIEHLKLIQEHLKTDSEILAAKLCTKTQRVDILNRFKAGELKCVLATQLADEGLDVPILSCVALVFPGKQSDLVLQQVGRALREYKGKDSAMILDVVDKNVYTLNSHWHTRRRSYKKWGFKIVGNGVADRVVLPLAMRSPTTAVKKARQRRASVHPDQMTFYPTGPSGLD